MSPDQFRELGRRMVDWIADYMERVESLLVLSRATPGEVGAALPAAAPERGEPWDAIFGDLERIIVPGLTHWQSPNFFAYFPCNASGPGILGELLSAGLNVNGMMWATSPAATELETRMLDWMARAMALPEKFVSTSANGGGCIQGTASESTLIAMIAARARAGPGADLVAYASAHAHSSIVKAAMILGIARGPEDRERVRLIEVDGSYRTRPEALEGAIRADLEAGRTPFFVCATVGTTSTTSVDPLDEIGGVLARAGLAGRTWLHVDAAHAGPAMLCEEFRWMFRGVEHADSVCMNPHKWMLTNFDCDLFWTSDREALVSALSITPEYLRNAASESGAVIDYRDWQIPLGRRFRALKLWFVLRHYGLEGLRAHLREHVRLAAMLERWVAADARFELAAPRTLNLVCFRLRGEGAGAEDANRRLMEALNASGRMYLTHTVLNGRTVLRVAIGASGTQERHVADAWGLIQRTAGEVLGA
jgi:aromatic-L-amino-acid decarboxylase